MDVSKTVVSSKTEEAQKKNQPRKRKSDKSLMFKTIFTLCLMVALPVLMVLVNSSKHSQDIRSKAKNADVPASSKIFFVPFSFSKDDADDVLINFEDRPEIRNGYLPVSQIYGKKVMTATLLDIQGNPILAVQFAPPDLVAIDSYDGVSKKEHAQMKKVVGKNDGLSLPYDTNTVFLKIQNDKGDVISMISLQDAESINNLVNPEEVNTDVLNDKIDYIKRENEENKQKLDKISLTVTPNITRSRSSSLKDSKKSEEEIDNKLPTVTLPLLSPTKSKPKKEQSSILKLRFLLKDVSAAGGIFNIAIIGDNYGTNNTLFQSDVSDIIAALLSIEPFSLNKANIYFYTQLATIPICTPVSGWPSISCNDTTALQQASNIPYDKIYVLYNGPYTGYAYVGGILAYGTSSTDLSLKVKQGLFIHEFAGHALGGLMDEYSYGTTGSSYAPNCSATSSCPAWSSITGLSCFTTCGFTNLYRATDNGSVMNTAFLNGIMNFDTYSTQIVQNQLLSYIQKSQQITIYPTLTPSIPPTPTSAYPTPTYIQPTLTAIVTIVPTSTSLVMISPTPTVSSFGSPTPTLTTVHDDSNPYIIPSPTSTYIPTISHTDIQPTLTQSPSRFVATVTSAANITVTSSPTSSSNISVQTNTLTFTLTPSAPFSSCAFPNYCTLAKYCGEGEKTAISCGNTNQICCKPVENLEKEKTSKEQNNKEVNNIFQPLPTLPTISSKEETTGQFHFQGQNQQAFFISPTLGPNTPTQIRPFPTQQEMGSENKSIVDLLQYPSPTAEISDSNPFATTPIADQLAGSFPSPTLAETDLLPQLPDISPTSFSLDTLQYEQITPTPKLANPVTSSLGVIESFLTGLVKSVLPGLFD